MRTCAGGALSMLPAQFFPKRVVNSIGIQQAAGPADIPDPPTLATRAPHIDMVLELEAYSVGWRGWRACTRWCADGRTVRIANGPF